MAHVSADINFRRPCFKYPRKNSDHKDDFLVQSHYVLQRRPVEVAGMAAADVDTSGADAPEEPEQGQRKARQMSVTSFASMLWCERQWHLQRVTRRRGMGGVHEAT